MTIVHKYDIAVKDALEPRLCKRREASEPIPTDEELEKRLASCSTHWRRVTCKECKRIGASRGVNFIWDPYS